LTTTPVNKEFSDFVATQDARNTIQLNVTKFCLILCDALTQTAPQTGSNIGFYLDSMGRKYHKIFMTKNGKQDSIHAFIDKKTGEMYKPASIKAPAKGVRFNLLIMQERQFVLDNCEWSGGYLYRNAYYQGS
jgi:hypothetical protein